MIVQRCKDQSRREAMLSHFHDLMVLVSSYMWSAVRAFHYKVVRSIEMGLASWGDSFDTFKQPFFLPTALLANSSANFTSKLETSPRPAHPPSLRYRATKSSTPGHGMTTATTRNVPYGTSASSASVIIRPKAVQNGNTLSPPRRPEPSPHD